MMEEKITDTLSEPLRVHILRKHIVDHICRGVDNSLFGRLNDEVERLVYISDLDGSFIFDAEAFFGLEERYAPVPAGIESAAWELERGR